MANIWKELRYFKKKEFEDPDKIDYELLMLLDKFRAWVRKPINIHCAYEKRDNPSSQHNYGRAVDCHIVGLSLFDQMMAALKFCDWTGVGVYPDWNSPGLHLDIRNIKPPKKKKTWMKKNGSYIALSEKNILNYVINK